MHTVDKQKDKTKSVSFITITDPLEKRACCGKFSLFGEVHVAFETYTNIKYKRYVFLTTKIIRKIILTWGAGLNCDGEAATGGAGFTSTGFGFCSTFGWADAEKRILKKINKNKPKKCTIFKKKVFYFLKLSITWPQIVNQNLNIIFSIRLLWSN